MDAIKRERINNKEGWIGVDLDGTLAHFPEGEYDTYKIGRPIPAMVERVKKWIEDGREVKIFTARAEDHGYDRILLRGAINSWLVNVAGLPPLNITNEKDKYCIEIWDDRAVQVKFNEGEPVGGNYIV